MNVVGLMSGTSLDGLDIALVRFSGRSWTLRKTLHVPYNEHWMHRLSTAHNASGIALIALDHEYGRWMGQQVSCFAGNCSESIDLISAHGHTVFHQPEQKLTLQIGNGHVLCAETNTPVVCDFRTADVVMGGQGAPLVPRGDLDLFPEFDAWLNLGGMANITVRHGGSARAWDLAPCNMVFNFLSAREGLSYDKDGVLADSGSYRSDLATALEALPYFKQFPPKSLGREWVETQVFPLLEDIPTADAMHTCMRTFARLMVAQIPNHAHAILVSGGGAHNRSLMNELNSLRPAVFVSPQKHIIDFKEAIVFAYLGYLRYFNQPNILHEVTGVNLDHSGGVLFSPTFTLHT